MIALAQIDIVATATIIQGAARGRTAAAVLERKSHHAARTRAVNKHSELDRRIVMNKPPVMNKLPVMNKPPTSPLQSQRARRDAQRIARGKRQRNGVAAYKADREIIGKGTKIAVISLPPGDLAALDAAATRVQMSRSAFIRQAVKHFIAKVLPERAT